mmetsp:Transcript_44339/g.86753  ORF Transcript_44339/g.86753 Transcript_44339/m.86753 type:complete len:4144 (+) Transcript_44339:98-12529(+)|eukprot:CAMPEP_0175135790 /NCGR_PEP_ID=MMETSP0087-20121206/8926_1 /TAXON_ID=136419 /ORGANISM="Unknown Unknown, Strain D1" /LENGTH=4143 /DNA_ID=CAMNT_0016418495 /DNA_START=97 /DNA_END=12528 /DNA_ORIENTATION=+
MEGSGLHFTRPRPEEVVAKSKFDQQQLVSRLYRSHGASFQGQGTPMMPTRPVVKNRDDKLGVTRPESNFQATLRAKYVHGAGKKHALDDDQNLVVSKSKRLHLLNKASEEEKARERKAQVNIPKNLQSLLGQKMSLKNTVYLPNRATVLAGGGSGPQFSATGQLPISNTALQEIYQFAADEESQASRPQSAAGYSKTSGRDKRVSSSERSRDHQQLVDNVGNSQSEYEKYLRSPFSFIDKVIESPYTEEFVYLNPRGPYDLEIVKHDQIDPDNYYTMSRAGVTHFYQTETDFTSLDQWEREYFLFTKMMEIPFFKKFRMWKAFYFWKKLIRKQKSNKYRKFLQENLYILNPYLRDSLIQLRTLCYNASKWTLFKVDPKNTLTLAEFQAAQENQKQVVMELLDNLNKDVRRIVLEACEVDLREFLISNGFRASKTGGDANMGEDVGALRGDDDYPQKISHAEKAANRTKCRKLTKYIRLADYFIIDTLVTLCMDRTADVLQFVQRKSPMQLAAQAKAAALAKAIAENPEKAAEAEKAGKDKVPQELPLFSTEIMVDEDTNELMFVPCLEEFQTHMEASIDSAVRKVMAPKRLINDPDFESYTKQNAADDNDDQSVEFKLEQMVLLDSGFIDVKLGIKKGLADGFEEATVHRQSFEYFRAMYVENNATDIESFRGSTTRVFEELVAKYEAQIHEFNEIEPTAMIGIIECDARNLKAMLLPSPTRCNNELKALIPAVAREKASALLEELKQSKDKVAGIPATVEDFVELMNFLTKTADETDKLAARYMFISEMYGLIHESEIKIPDADKQCFEKLTQTKQHFKQAVLLAEGGINSNTDRFSKSVLSDIPGLEKDIKGVFEALKDPSIEDVANIDNMDGVIGYLEEQKAKLDECQEKATRFKYYQDVLQVEVHTYDDLPDTSQDMDVKLGLWKGLKEWDAMSVNWTQTKFNDVEPEEITNQVNIYNKIYSKAKRLLENNPVVPILRKKISHFQETMPIVTDLRNPNLQEHHWAEINSLLNYDVQADEEFSLGKLIELDAMQHRMAIQAISTKAGQESALRELLGKVEATWADLNLEIKSHKGQKDVYIMGGLDEIIAALDESLVTVNTIMGSRFVEPIREIVVEWNRKLILFQETLDEWMACQRSWMYLETIFSSQDIQRQLPKESDMFKSVDDGWRKIMRRTNDESNAIVAGTYAGLKDSLIHYNVVLDKVQKQLESYLETKRRAFPRFYFLSNDELLQILSQSKNVEAVQPHLRKFFENVNRLEFADKDIKCMYSAEGERVPLGQNLKARGSVEIWLRSLEEDVVKTMTKFMKAGVVDYEKMSRKEWILEKFGQVVMTVSQIAWCRGCEQSLTDENPIEAMNNWYDLQSEQLSVLVDLVRGNLSSIDRKKIVALITTDVHGRDVVDKLKGVSDINDFKWQQQLRFYWDADVDNCIVRQANGKFGFGYEYMGVTSRLVITPLTDRCWMTITGALTLKFGAAPAGPAGTGKTESTKDLAKAMGIYCIVFNCSDQIGYQQMAKLFSGLAQAGAWTCLDEFNRIDIEVLSVVAQQLLQVRQAMTANVTEFVFGDSKIPLVPGFGVMITMNPGYAGRTELPDNLKVLFRPVSMMVPDYALIAEIILFAEGFGTASYLSKKMTKLYKLSSEQLSAQDHYDFGMRAVKSVLVMAGSLKRAEPDLTEDVVLIRAMKDSNIPKFLSDDIPLFLAIVQDLFPGVVIPVVDYGPLEVSIRHVINEAGLQAVDKFVTKVIQLFDTLNIRFGVMIVGPTGGGKTTCYQMLKAAMTNLRENDSPDERFQIVNSYVLNPKCVTMGELYGEINLMTQEWTDGLASTLMREAIKDDSDERHWVVFDGPVDALWIENMNTVLDDNMTLCLVNGERIKLKVELRMVFEVQDLAVASPATVSRCGMVYLTPGDLGYMPYVKSWLPRLPEQMPEELKDHLHQSFLTHLKEGIAFMRSEGKEPIATVNVQLATNICQLFEALFTEEHGVNFEEPLEELTKLCDKVFAFCFAWGVGGSLSEETCAVFSKQCDNWFKDCRPTGPIFNFSLDIATKEWVSWNEKVAPFVYDGALPYFSLIVPTMDTVKYSFLLETLLEVQRSSFFTGLSGVGKSVIVADTFDQIKDKKGIVPVMMAFSAQTNARKTQESIEGKLVKLRRTQLGAPVGKKLVIFVDDINMPAVEEYGAQPPIELLRQFQDHKGFFDRTKLFWKDIVDTTIVAAAAPPGGGRMPLTPRFARHFNIFNVPQPSDEVLKKIFGSILDGFLGAFKGPIQKLSGAMVASTIELYNTIAVELLPTPAKSHYTFNLRDISKVFQGVLMILPQNCAQPDTMVKLWIHEATRCFHDRLINDEDKSWFTHKIVALLSRHFQLSWKHEELFESGTPIIFGDYFRPGGDRFYEMSTSPNIQRLFDDYLEDYNLASPAKMNLIFFQDAIDHVSRICRIIRQPRGNALLVGVGGSGKQSLTRLACSMAEYKCMMIELTRGYGHADFQEFVKSLMIIAGVEGKDVVFLFNENQIVQERFLEDTNNILNSGEVPNLFPSDETQKIIDDLSPILRDLGVQNLSREVVLQNFVKRVRDKLHIVLAMSPVGNSFRTRCRQFPSLINCTTIDWYTKWPREALHSVSKRFLADLSLPSEEVREALVETCVKVHLSMDDMCERFFGELRRQVYTTPKSYLDMINLYLDVLAFKRAELATSRNRLVVGLQKLSETTAVVDELSAAAEELKPVLITKTAEAEELLAKVAVDKEAADKVKSVVEVEEKVVSTQAAEVAEIQADAQADLDKALPALKAAMSALDNLKKSDISEVKALANPPVGVMKTMAAVCILLEQKTDWDTAKKVMGGANFMKSLKELDKDNIKPKTIKSLAKYIEDPTFTAEKMKSVSVAASSLCAWVCAMVIYSEVAKEVEPKKARVAEMNALLEAANAKLAEKQSQLQEVLDKVAALESTAQITVNEKNKLQENLKLTEGRLARAEKLTGGLGSEAARWKVDSERLAHEIELLVGDTFISAAAVSYIGPFTGEYRRELVLNWTKFCQDSGIPTADDFSLVKTLGQPVAIRQWNIDGLPTDETSVDSAIMVKNGSRFPLMIDPQEQAKKWIKNSHKGKMVITRMKHKDLLRHAEKALRAGHSLLIEDIEESIEGSLDVILTKQIVDDGGRKVIKIGDNMVDWEEDFNLYITTKLPNPHYMPEICIKVNVLNFTVTLSGLEDQLLGDVVKQERPDVEARKNKLVVTMAEDKAQLAELESRILKLLSESTGNILDDVVLIDTLGESNATSKIINQRVAESLETEKDITAIRDKYRPVAIRGSIIYFVISDLALIDPMYQYSLAFFVKLFNLCIEQSEKSDDLDKRLGILMEFCTENIFVNICRGLFEKDKLIFSFLIVVNILIQSDDVKRSAFLLLLKSSAGLVVDKTGIIDNPDPEVISDQSWTFLCQLHKVVPEYEGVCDSVAAEWEDWKEWILADKPHEMKLPGKWEEALTPFYRMLFIKAFRAEKLIFAIANFVKEIQGKAFVEFVQAPLEVVHRDTDVTTPIIFVLSVGADPTGLLLRFAKDCNFTEKLKIISLGQGQGENAKRLITDAKQKGEWVLLQNCHLAKSFMPELETVVDNFAEEPDIHQDFRLWLTSMPANYFPVAVLQRGIKLTNEPPRGVRANLMRSFTTVIDAEGFERCTKPAPWKKLMFGLMFFHATIQERKKFGPLGWNIMYEFNDSDLETSISVLRMFLDEQDHIPWDSLLYICGHINYGGRVTDDWDRRCLMSILHIFFTTGILDDKYAFSPSGVYYAPVEGALDDYKSYVDSLPANEDPEIFGMHENANITFQNKETNAILSTALDLQPREMGSEGGQTPDEIVAQLAQEFAEKCPDFLKEVQLVTGEEEGASPPKTPAAEGEEVEPEAAGDDEVQIDSLVIVLRQEIELFNRMLEVVKKSLTELQKAIKGEVVMSDELDKMYNNLMINRVPEQWTRWAYPSLKPLAPWFVDMVARVQFLRSWIEDGAPNSFWMSGMFYPQGFMTATLQNHARKYKLPIDSLRFKFSVQQQYRPEEIDICPEDGVYINGLFMDGARWNPETGTIFDSKLGELFSEVPIIHFLPSNTHVPNEKDYQCPVYKTSVRAGKLSTTGESTNFVLPVELPSSESPDYWVLKGAAFLCQLDE